MRGSWTRTFPIMLDPIELGHVTATELLRDEGYISLGEAVRRVLGRIVEQVEEIGEHGSGLPLGDAACSGPGLPVLKDPSRTSRLGASRGIPIASEDGAADQLGN